MKRMIFMAVVVLMTLAAKAQIVYGDKTGWTAYTTEDDYSGKKSHYMQYFDEKRRLAASFFLQGRLGLLEWYDGSLYFDVTFDAVMDNRGHISSKQIDYEIRIAQPKGESSEDYGEVELKFSDVEKSGETFFGTFVIDADVEEMKSGQSVAVRWNDPIRGRKTVKKISLVGFTKAYNECLRRYKEGR